MIIKSNFIDFLSRTIYPASIELRNGKVFEISIDEGPYNTYLLPGLIDSHIHIESSMCTPGAFAVAAVSRGTTSVISDPHEIGNVLGVKGVEFMIDDSKKVPLKYFFGAPSCVPATDYETSGASINAGDIEYLMGKREIKFLSELMNFPGVINDNRDVWEKIDIAHKVGKPIDGHAPGLKGEYLKKYIAAGILTDHECSTLEEAEEKISLGMKIQIREGSAARNFDTLKILLKKYPEKVMLCSDDLHPEMLVKGHINLLVARLVSEGFDLFDTIKSCTYNPALHYSLNTGIIKPGMPADFIIVDDPGRMNVFETFIEGEKVFDRGKVLFDYRGASPINNFSSSKISKEDIRIIALTDKLRVIKAFNGQLYTKEEIDSVVLGEEIEQNTDIDLLKIVIKDRYKNSPPNVAYIRGFGLKSGAFASSVSHDSHNIVCVGTNDEDIVATINSIVEMRGGLVFANGEEIISLPLEIGGIMSDRPVEEIAEKYQKISDAVKNCGCTMEAPFMSLSFMALLVIPELKISDKGLFKLSTFSYVPLFQ
jgi:adenine deaminase